MLDLRPRRDFKAELDLTPFMDVIFILLLFFIIASAFAVRGLDFSPVKGPEGNIEYLMFVQKSEEPCVLDDAAAEQVVAASHSTLDR